MRRAGWIGATAAIVVAAGLAYVAAEHVAQARLVAGLQAVRANLGPGATLRYARAEASPFTLGATLDQAAITRDDAVLTADRVVLHGVHAARLGRLELVNPSLRRNGIVAGASDLTVEGLAPDPAAGQPDAVRFDHAAISDLLVTLAALPGNVPQAAAGATPAVVFRSGAMQIDDVAAGQPGHVLLQDSSLTTAFGARTTVQADALRYDETALSATLNRLLNGHAYALPPQDSVTVAGGPLTISGSGVAPIRAASLRATSVRNGAVETTVALHGLQAALSPPPGSFAAQLGYDHFEADLTLTSRLDPVNRRFVLGPLVLDDRNMAIMRLDATLVAPGTTPAAQWQTMQLAGGSIAITDQGLAQHILAAIARQHGMTAANLRAQLAAKVAQTPEASGTAPTPLSAAMRFLVQSGTLTFTAHPPAPLALTALAGLRGQGLPALMTALGLQVQLSPP